MHPELMRSTPRHGQRGQAITETLFFLPMILLGFFGIMWAVQAAVQYERVESAVRYNGLISQGENPYVGYSLYALYTQLGVTSLPAANCVLPVSAALSDAASTYTSGASPPFWSPSTTTPPVLQCSLLGTNGIIGLPAGTGLTQDVILSNQTTTVTSYTPVIGPLRNTLNGGTTASTATGTFFKPVGVNVILACYRTLNTQITASLEYQTDTSAATAPAALPSTITAPILAANDACTSNW